MSATAMLALLFFSGCSQNKEMSQDPEMDQYFSNGNDFAGSHILISWQGAARAGQNITRTKEEALARAKELTAKVLKNPDSFEDVAKAESDGPSAPNGGSLGAWPRGNMVPEFDEAIEKLDVGEITAEPVETPFGYHIIRRESEKVKYYAAYGFVIAHAGVPQLPKPVTRTKEQADSLAQSLKGKVTAANFDEMAAEYNDIFDKPVFLGAFSANEQLPDGLLETIQELEYGEVAGPIEFPIGYSFIRRVKAEQLAGSHILISYAGAERAAESTTRTKEEALATATQIADELATEPEHFAALAAENSDDQSGQTGGSLGVWFKGSMVPVFDSTIVILDEGSITATPVESQFGYHIIRRDSIPQ